MSPVRAYLAGPMTNHPAFNYPAFDKAAKELRAAGHEIISPAELDEPHIRTAVLKSKDGNLAALQKSTGESFADFLSRDIKIVVGAETEAVIVLPGWENSRGATLEVYVAGELGKPILRYPDMGRVEKVPCAGVSATMCGRCKNSAEGAKPSNHSPTTTPITEPRTGSAIGANPAMRSATPVGSEPISRRSAATTASGGLNQEPASSGTESPARTTSGCLKSNPASAPSATDPKLSSSEEKSDPSTSTTTKQLGSSEDSSALHVIPGSGSSNTIRFDWNVPPDSVHPSSLRFYAILGSLGQLHAKKQRDYGRADDPFANVRATDEWGIAGWVGAMIRATDKIRRLQTFARRGTLANEGVIDAFDDLAVYAVIGRVLFEEDLPSA